MTSNHDFGIGVSRWLHDEAQPEHAPYLADVLARTSGTRQRSAWSSSERWLPMDLTFPTRRLPLAPMRLVIAVVLVATLTLLLVLFAGARRVRLPEPFGPAANGSILTDGADGDIYVAAPDGTNTRPLITGSTSDGGPWFTHDGTQFVFVRKAEQRLRVDIMIARADGTDIRQLTETPLVAMDWYEISPDDKRLAVVHGVDGKHVLSILDIETREMHQLSVPGLDVDYDVLWLPPHGEELIFTARPKGYLESDVGLYGIRPDGSGFRGILPPLAEEHRYQGIAVADDGKQLTYWQYETEDSGATWNAYVHLVDLATGADRRMTFDPANVHESELRFSPDGKLGVIVAGDDKDAYLQIVDLVGSTPARRAGPTFRGNEDKAFGFSPDGKQVIFAIDNTKPIFIDVATGNVTTGSSVWNVYAAWQRLAP